MFRVIRHLHAPVEGGARDGQILQGLLLQARQDLAAAGAPDAVVVAAAKEEEADGSVSSK
jgi:hypothetical protein